MHFQQKHQYLTLLNVCIMHCKILIIWTLYIYLFLRIHKKSQKTTRVTFCHTDDLFQLKYNYICILTSNINGYVCDLCFIELLIHLGRRLKRALYSLYESLIMSGKWLLELIRASGSTQSLVIPIGLASNAPPLIYILDGNTHLCGHISTLLCETFPWEQRSSLLQFTGLFICWPGFRCAS